jgi:hypothetical protein
MSYKGDDTITERQLPYIIIIIPGTSYPLSDNIEVREYRIPDLCINTYVNWWGDKIADYSNSGFMYQYLRKFNMEYISYKKVFTGGSTFIICLTCMWTYILGKTNHFRIISKIMVGHLQKPKMGNSIIGNNS